MRSAVRLGLLTLCLACASQHSEPARRPPVSECAAILATIPYLDAGPAAPALDESGASELGDWIDRLRADPELRVELAVHMAAAARELADPTRRDAGLQALGDDVLARFRAAVHPADRVTLVVHGVPGGPPDDPLAGSWLQLRGLCPPYAPDHDRDGVADPDDPCPDLPEDYDRHQDHDGCPDRDNDGDGVLDAARWTGSEWVNCDGRLEPGKGRHDCRNQPETVDGEEDDDGCPEAFVAGCGRFVVRIPYDPDTLELDEHAFLELDARRKQLAPRYRTGGNFSLEGHTGDDLPPDQARRLGLTMAEKVRDTLVDRGFVHVMLVPTSRGADSPIAADAEARRDNYRVELVAGLACATPSRPLCP
ncbi:hypothetical protein [Nannocystis radixulma]|uniref:OmpA family protein n=1 Tax=Nannocystis radixulma TaxID=2995305 RepID=A0ABT5BMT7_9BACT|nr:hypothetical protein [Nannocystis radixulma]MDC0674317.1 hypothetical protein [Nannocystis radixulma]